MYVCIDAEYGGLDRDTSILTAYFGIADKEFNIVAELDLSLIPDDTIYKVTGGGMKVNQIDLSVLAEYSIPYHSAKKVLGEFLRTNYLKYGERFIPIGNGVANDIQRITETISNEKTWGQFVSYRVLDTCSIGMYLQDKGLLPKELGLSIKELSEYFGVKAEGVLHEAKYDAQMGLGVYKGLLSL